MDSAKLPRLANLQPNWIVHNAPILVSI